MTMCPQRSILRTIDKCQHTDVRVCVTRRFDGLPSDAHHMRQNHAMHSSSNVAADANTSDGADNRFRGRTGAVKDAHSVASIPAVQSSFPFDLTFAEQSRISTLSDVDSHRSTMMGAEPRRTTVVVRTELTVHDDGRVTTETTSNTSVEVDWDWDPNAWLEVSQCACVGSESETSSLVVSHLQSIAASSRAFARCLWPIASA